MCKNRLGAKGQVFSIDFIMAVIVFVLCMVFITSFWQVSVVSASQAVERNRLAASALVASDALIYGSGMPDKWESSTSDAVALGLAKKGSPGELEQAKLAAFSELSNSSSGTVRKLLGLHSEYYLQVQGVESDYLFEAGNSSQLGSRSVGITRYAVLDGEMVRVRFYAHD